MEHNSDEQTEEREARLVNQELLSFDTYSEKLNILKTQTAQQC